jgi:peptide deformylase
MPVDPASLSLQIYPKDVLRRKAKPIDPTSPEVREVALRMIDMMYDEEGIGLAAPQVGLGWRLFVADVPENEERSASDVPPSATTDAVVYCNPVLSAPVGDPVAAEEGCLSLPDIRGDVLRPPTITMTYQDLRGNTITETATGLLARCWQHEIDHLDGVLIIDKMTWASRLKTKTLVRALERGG